MRADLIKKYAAPVPRYTSYPTAPHFAPNIGDVQYVAWLSALPDGAALSLYVHIPFCHRLCWYCGCNTKATRRHAPVTGYLQSLQSECANLGALVPPSHRVAHLHWGGGSPNILSASDIAELADTLQASFNVERTAEFAVEIDPRYMDDAKVDAFARAGVTRVSIGVQDFDPVVQAAIGREQSFETTRSAVSAFRQRGIESINIDLMYGLPHQTGESVERTIDEVMALQPDRIAIFGYAHLPDRMRHQRLMPEDALPNARERFDQSSRLALRLTAAGYVSIGLDHFAKPSDALVTKAIGRNFQGYTTDRADALLGIGASAIGRLPQGYVQNAVAVADYERRMRLYGLATAKGRALSADDRARGHVIERLMCDFAFSAADARRRFGTVADDIVRDAEALLAADRDGLVERTADGFVVSERGRPFIRSICARFDAYLERTSARHAAGL